MGTKAFEKLVKVSIPSYPWSKRAEVTPGELPRIAGGMIEDKNLKGVFSEDYLQKCKDANFNVVRNLNGTFEQVKNNGIRAKRKGLKTFMRFGIKGSFSIPEKGYPDYSENLNAIEESLAQDLLRDLKKVSPSNEFWDETYRNWKTNIDLLLDYSNQCISQGLVDPLNTITGFMLADEPAASHFWGLSRAAEIIREEFLAKRPDKIPFIMNNLFFDITSGDTSESSYEYHVNRLSGFLNNAKSWLNGYYPIKCYDDFVDLYSNLMRPSVLSFDCYPFTQDQNVSQGQNTFRPNSMRSFFETLIYYNNRMKDRNIDFWTTVMCCSFTPTDENTPSNPPPSLGMLRFAAFVALLYGAKGIQYWGMTPGATDGTEGDMPFNTDGTTTKTYDFLKTLNAQIKAIESILLNSTLVETVVTRYPPYTYTKSDTGVTNKFTIKGLITKVADIGCISGITGETEEGFLIAVMEDTNFRYTIMASMNPENIQSSYVRFKSASVKFLEPVNMDSSWSGLSLNESKFAAKTFTFAPGDIKIFRLPKGA